MGTWAVIYTSRGKTLKDVLNQAQGNLSDKVPQAKDLFDTGSSTFNQWALIQHSEKFVSRC